MSKKTLILIDRIEGIEDTDDLLEYMEQYIELGYKVRVEPIIMQVQNPFGSHERTKYNIFIYREKVLGE